MLHLVMSKGGDDSRESVTHTVEQSRGFSGLEIAIDETFGRIARLFRDPSESQCRTVQDMGAARTVGQRDGMSVGHLIEIPTCGMPSFLEVELMISPSPYPGTRRQLFRYQSDFGLDVAEGTDVVAGL